MNARVTFLSQPLVWIEIRGEKDPRSDRRMRVDGGLISRFLKWSEQEKIWPVMGRGGHSGGGSFGGAYRADDAERIGGWLRGQGVIELFEMPS